MIIAMHKSCIVCDIKLYDHYYEQTVIVTPHQISSKTLCQENCLQHK